MTAPMAPTRGSGRAARTRRGLSTGARAVVAAVIAVLTLAAGLVTWHADSAAAGASAPLRVLAWVLLVAGVAAPLAALVLGAIAIRTGSGRTLGAVALLAALVTLVLVGFSALGAGA